MAECPVHGRRLEHKRTRYGGRWNCPVQGCDVVWWGRKNTTPAGELLRQARIAAHDTFDALWKPPTRLMTRAEAYKWLGQMFGLTRAEAHIGLFNLKECELVIQFVQAYRERYRGNKSCATSKHTAGSGGTTGRTRGSNAAAAACGTACTSASAAAGINCGSTY